MLINETTRKSLRKAYYRYANRKDGIAAGDKDGRWLGALASHATKPGATSLREAVDEWERITGQCSTDAGCPCCGQPHNFTLYVNGETKDYGPHARYEASWD